HRPVEGLTAEEGARLAHVGLPPLGTEKPEPAGGVRAVEQDRRLRRVDDAGAGYLDIEVVVPHATRLGLLTPADGHVAVGRCRLDVPVRVDGLTDGGHE